MAVLDHPAGSGSGAIHKLIKKTQMIKIFDSVRCSGKPTGLARYHIWSYQIVRIELYSSFINLLLY